MVHTLTWYEAGQVRRVRITAEEELYAAVRAILSRPLCTDEELGSGLSGMRATESRRLIAAAAGEESLLKSMQVYANDLLWFIGDEVPPAFAQRIVHSTAVSDGEQVAEAITGLIGMGVRL